jgi:hypothetical protein
MKKPKRKKKPTTVVRRTVAFARGDLREIESFARKLGRARREMGAPEAACHVSLSEAVGFILRPGLDHWSRRL